MRHSERFWTDCGYGKSDIDSAAGSEGLGFGSVIGFDSSECHFGEYVETYCLNFVPGSGFDSVEVSENFHFHYVRHSDFDSLFHYVEDWRTCVSERDNHLLVALQFAASPAGRILR